jgi:hypothetical protein
MRNELFHSCGFLKYSHSGRLSHPAPSILVIRRLTFARSCRVLLQLLQELIPDRLIRSIRRRLCVCVLCAQFLLADLFTSLVGAIAAARRGVSAFISSSRLGLLLAITWSKLFKYANICSALYMLRREVGRKQEQHLLSTHTSPSLYPTILPSLYIFNYTAKKNTSSSISPFG